TRDVAVSPAAVDQVVLAVGVFEHELVDGLRTVVELVDEGLPEMILEGAGGLVGDGYADAADGVVVLDVVRAEEEVVATILFDDRRCPHRAFGPLDLARVEDARVLRPSDEILGREAVEEDLLVVGG